MSLRKTAAFLSLISIAAGTLGLAGTIMSVNGIKQEGRAESKANQYNAAIMRQQAEDAKARGLEEQVSAARKNKQLLGQQRAMMAANGVDLSSATPMELFTQTAEFGEEDRQTIIDNTNREVWGYNTQATLYDMAAKQAKKAAKRNTISTILGGGSNLLFMGAQAGWSGGRSSGNGVTERGGGTSSATINGIYQGSRTW